MRLAWARGAAGACAMRQEARHRLLGATGQQRRAAGVAMQAASPLSSAVNTVTIAVSTVEQEDPAAVPSPSPAPPPPEPTPPSGMAAAAPAEPMKIADIDATRFALHPSVDYWRTFSNQFTFDYAPVSSIAGSLMQVVSTLASLAVVRDPQSAAFWAYHTARMSFFITQAVGVLVTHQLSESLGLAASGGLGEAFKTPLQRISSNGPARELYARVREAMATFKQDYDNIRSGAYPLPWDMTTPGHRQYNPLFVLNRSLLFLQDGAATLQRRVRNKPDPVWLQSRLYPQYYTKTFHYQTDGWFSDKSARVYEHSTETLFFGRQDAMQRTSLLPLASYVAAAAQQGRDVRQMRLLEVAAGTGRFHTFIKDAYPDLPSVVSDLSPYYLAQARDNVSRWKRLRQPNRYLGGTDDTGVEFLQTAVEDIAAPDSSFDVVVCVYLFHELPEAIRRRAAAEFARVLKPGGLMVLTDSTQLGDRPEWDATVGQFGDFNEPYYRSYVECDLGQMFEEAGFVCGTKYLSSATKTLSFIKPDTTVAAAAN